MKVAIDNECSATFGVRLFICSSTKVCFKTKGFLLVEKKRFCLIDIKQKRLVFKAWI